jgi:predicted CXXCH cytochrome family protein
VPVTRDGNGCSGLVRILRLTARAACVAILAALLAPAHAADGDECAKCHAALFQKSSVHGAVSLGCKSCHVPMDAESPHKVRGKVAKGLPMEANAQCLTCHEKKHFEGKVVHGPVAAGLCLACHDPHASDHLGLLRKPPAEQCLDCHPEVSKGPHVIAGFSRSGHPLGENGKTKQTEDPLRPGRKFYCVSCHEPHSSELPRLNRFPKGMDSCLKCHRM